MKRFGVALLAIALSAQTVTVQELTPEESATAILAYAKYQKAKKAWMEQVLNIVYKYGVRCPSFSKTFAYVINDPQCADEETPAVAEPEVEKPKAGIESTPYCKDIGYTGKPCLLKQSDFVSGDIQVGFVLTEPRGGNGNSIPLIVPLHVEELN